MVGLLGLPWFSTWLWFTATIPAICLRPRCCASWPKPEERVMNQPALQRPRRQLQHPTVYVVLYCYDQILLNTIIIVSI